MKISKGLLGYGICLFLIVAAFPHAQAVPISGSASFLGTATASGPSGGGTTTINFSNNWNFLTGTGTFSGIPQTAATLHNFSFTGDGTSVNLSAQVLPLWSFTSGGNNYSFDLLSLSSGHTEAGSMAFTGAGTLHATNFDNTPASFGMTGSGTNFVYTLSFITNTAVPEPSTFALAGFGLALCGAVARFRGRKSGSR